MQELRIVLIIVGILAIAGLLIHGLWTNRREQSGKFSDKPLGKLQKEEPELKPVQSSEIKQQDQSTDDFDVVKVSKSTTKQEPSFSALEETDNPDPLMFSDVQTEVNVEDDSEHLKSKSIKTDALPTITISSDAYSKHFDEDIPSVTAVEEPEIEPVFEEPQPQVVEPQPVAEQPEPAQVSEDKLEVLVLHVQAAHHQQFAGTNLFESMEQNGLIFGAMNIYHRHSDLTSNGKVLFSVANMMKPGTFEYIDPASFYTDGISFFMTLPCYGDAEQNFKLMLHTAQMIADDLGGNVLDDKYALMTRDRIDAFKRQVQQFEANKKAQQASQAL
ncbi:cell division protein ZipA [Vibrio gallicus]|uniref:cell division protein ZipA n=1 Tax=Vibrio gallicus TaxID=190897 RepID=UPI0021C3BE9A|nr:cell division protein ZipA [Vibrio gallicus]